MPLSFVKYQGTGNDFILVDDRAQTFPADDVSYIAHLCHRRFGIGADGLILLQESLNPADCFSMVYFNADGNPSTFCGNGGRCIVAFAAELGLLTAGDTITFNATDGQHAATYISGQHIELKMHCSGPPIATLVTGGGTGYYVNTGSPHLIIHVDDVDETEVKTVGALHRREPQFSVYGGVNVNFVQKVSPTHLRVRTYERGVEDETYSCGTGVTAAALWAAPGLQATIDTPGGILSVRSSPDLSDIDLIGPADRVYAGKL
jgi:diaminopimelate epimerase